MIMYYSSHTNREDEVYYYHGDHLGGANWITDASGYPVQHLQYLPFGERYIDQRAAGSTYQERFRFTGKERDEETGYSYFGARYMDHELLSSFISVDRYADKYPSVSPYAYCAWNPIRLADPTGDTIVIKGSTGYSYYWYQGNLYYDCNYKNKVTDTDYWKLCQAGESIPWNVSRNLNRINENTAGKRVLDKLSNDDLRHNISIEYCGEGGGASYHGDVFLNGDSHSLRNLSHELFHAYQYAKGRRGRSIFSEVEAYIFQAIVTNDPSDLMSRKGNEVYNAVINRLMSHFSISDFMYVTGCFRQEANVNKPTSGYPSGFYNKNRYNLFPEYFGLRLSLLMGLY